MSGRQNPEVTISMADSQIPYRLPHSTRNTAAGIFIGSIIAVLGFFLLCLWATTLYVADRFGYPPALGGPLVILLPEIARWAWLVAALLAIPRGRRYALGPLAVGLLALGLAHGPLYAPWSYSYQFLKYLHYLEQTG